MTSFTFDAAGQLKTLTDPVENTTSWFYDDLGRVIEEKNQLDKSRYFQYDAVGNLTQRTDRNGRVIQYVYDGRIKGSGAFIALCNTPQIAWLCSCPLYFPCTGRLASTSANLSRPTS